MRDREQHLPYQQSMKAGHKVRRFRRSNVEHWHDEGYLRGKPKQQSVRSAA
jgi:hypothetical protein